MSKLELTGNMLNSLPELDGIDISSTEILLENNTFHCNCEINEFYKWVMKSKEKIGKIECSAPQKFDGYNMLELKEREICDVTTTTTTTTTTKSTTTTTTKTTRKTTTPYSTPIFLPLPPGTRPPKTFIGLSWKYGYISLSFKFVSGPTFSYQDFNQTQIFKKPYLSAIHKTAFPMPQGLCVSGTRFACELHCAGSGNNTGRYSCWK